MRQWFRRHRSVMLPLVGYLVLSVGVLGGFVVASNNRAEGRRQVCEALREDRELLRDVIDVAIPPQAARQPDVDPALDPALRRLIEESRGRAAAIRRDIGRRLSRPIKLCDGTGIDPSVRLSAFDWGRAAAALGGP